MQEKKIKNQAFLKRGSYSLAITAAFIAGAIILNVLVGVLANRVSLEFDMTSEKVNSVSKENVEYIKGIKQEITVTVCADPEDYVGGYMAYYSQQYSVNDEKATDYYKQTVRLVERYADYNKKIKVEFVDPQDTAFSNVSTKYPNEKINYGDIIVSCENNGTERHKILTYPDIYSLTQNQEYSMYGYTIYTVEANKIETALTSAIAYVTGTDEKKVAILTGHSSFDFAKEYKTLLENNNYEVSLIEDTLIAQIPDTFDAVVIAAPVNDFLGSELDAISAFLDNGGKLGKGLIFFASVHSPYLPNLYDFLAQWGITVNEGIMFETNPQNQYNSSPTTLGSYASGLDSITSNVNICLTGNNIPLSQEFEEQGNIVVTPLVNTPDSVVAAPAGTTDAWGGADNYSKSSYSTVIQSIKEDYDDDNNQIFSYVSAFSSTDFIYSDFNEYSSVSNSEIVLAVSERCVGAENTGIYFTQKTITNESFQDKVTTSSTNTVQVNFMIVLPLICIAAGIFVYIKRRNA